MKQVAFLLIEVATLASVVAITVASGKRDRSATLPMKSNSSIGVEAFSFTFG
jgi:hypothetical protein